MKEGIQYLEDTRRWQHAGGKLMEVGAENLSDAELLAILISSGIKGRSAEKIAEDIISKFGSFEGIAHQPMEKFMKIKGLAEVKILRIFSAMEIAKRCVNKIIKDLKNDKELRKEIFGE